MGKSRGLTHLQWAILICSLGYLVDVMDIQLFAVLRVASLSLPPLDPP